MSDKIQRVEFKTYYDVSLHCPFCGQKVIDNEDDPEIEPCEHTLFIAHDEGLEYSSDLFEENVGIADLEEDEIDLPENGWDGLTDEVSLPDSIKFAAYVGAPSGFGIYVGFTPIELEEE